MNRTYKLALLGSLYLAQGLPYGFFTQALPVLMREAGMSLKMISASSLLFLPWALKFLWAPFVDAYGTPRLWLIGLQTTSVLLALLLAGIDLADSLLPVMLALFLFNLVSASQDTVTDGLAVRLLSTQERGLGNGIQVGGYRIGMILGGGALLWIFAQSGWTTMLLCMAGLLLLTCVPVLFLTESPHRPASTAPRLATVPLDWIQRLRTPGMASFVGLICCYKFGDSMVASLVGPYMKDAGLTLAEIAIVKGTIGSGVTLAGAAAGGWIAYRMGRRAAMLSCGLLQAGSLILYVAAAYGYGSVSMIYAASTAEHLFGGMATVALFTLMMDASDPEHASTDYTLLACAIVLAHGAAQFTGAVIADAVGYGPMFALGMGLAFAGCFALIGALDRQRGPQRLQSVWRSK